MATLTESIRILREQTGAGIMDCKRALEESDGDIDKAIVALKKHGLAVAAKKAGRAANQGLVAAYVHPGDRVGVLLEVNCETDFVARTPEFQALAHDIALQIAAMNPQVVLDERPLDDLDASQGEPRLLFQPFIKDTSRTVSDVITDAVARVGENIVVRRFIRYELGT